MLCQQIQRQQGIAQVIKNSHEQNNVELLLKLVDIVYRELDELDVESADLGGIACLCEVARIMIHSNHAVCSALLHFDREKAAVAADIQDSHAVEVRRKRVFQM